MSTKLKQAVGLIPLLFALIIFARCHHNHDFPSSPVGKIATPTGIFADVDYIQRIAIKGGKAPAQAPANATGTAEVPYEAIYRFTKKNP